MAPLLVVVAGWGGQDWGAAVNTHFRVSLLCQYWNYMC